MNKRKEARVDLAVPLELVNTQTKASLGRLVNISDNGFMLSTHSPVKEGVELQCSILVHSGDNRGHIHTIPLTVESVWQAEGNSHYQFWNGFRITSIRECDLLLLQSEE